jgi:hypothetical protein
MCWRAESKTMENSVTGHAKLIIMAALTIIGTVSTLSSHTEARTKGYLMQPQQAMPRKPIPLPPDCPRCGGRIKPGQDTISPLRSRQGKLDPQPEPWVPVGRLFDRVQPEPTPWTPAFR